MKVKFKTNVDAYQTNCWPESITIPPRKGETVLVKEGFIDYYANKRLPLSMEVVDVIWTDSGVICELWFNKIDVDAAALQGKNLLTIS